MQYVVEKQIVRKTTDYRCFMCENYLQYNAKKTTHEIYVTKIKFG